MPNMPASDNQTGVPANISAQFTLLLRRPLLGRCS